MIKARLEAKNLRIWLTCITLFLCGIILSAPFLGVINDDMLYSVFPFLDFGIVISGSIFGVELGDAFCNHFSFGVSLACIIAAVAMLAHIVYVIALCILRNQRRRAAKVLKTSGYCSEYFELLNNKRRQLAKSSLSSTNDLCLAKEYCDGRRYDSAFEILRNIDIDDFDLKDATRYYALYAYAFILTGDLKNARFALELGEPFVEKLKVSEESDFALALLTYAEHDFLGAKKAFGKLLNSKNVELKVWSGMYTGLIYLRLHQKEKARKIAVALSSCKKTPRQSEDMLKLLKKIEEAYALQAEEEADKSRKEFAVSGQTAEAAQ